MMKLRAMGIVICTAILWVGSIGALLVTWFQLNRLGVETWGWWTPDDPTGRYFGWPFVMMLVEAVVVAAIVCIGWGWGRPLYKKTLARLEQKKYDKGLAKLKKDKEQEALKFETPIVLNQVAKVEARAAAYRDALMKMRSAGPPRRTDSMAWVTWHEAAGVIEKYEEK